MVTVSIAVAVAVAVAVEVTSGSHRRWDWKNLMGQMYRLNRKLNQVNPIKFIEIDQEENYPEVVRGR